MSVADEAGAVVSAVYWTNKGASAVVKGTHRRAQNVGMRYQNWRHKGAGNYAVATPATTSTAPAKKGSAKNWTTDEEKLENTTTSVTTYTRKRTR